jgi:hypothetical protein
MGTDFASVAQRALDLPGLKPKIRRAALWQGRDAGHFLEFAL